MEALVADIPVDIDAAELTEEQKALNKKVGEDRGGGGTARKGGQGLTEEQKVLNKKVSGEWGTGCLCMGWGRATGGL